MASPPIHRQDQIIIIVFLYFLKRFTLKNIKLNNTKTNPIVCVNIIIRFENIHNIKFFLSGFLIVLSVYKRVSAEKKNNIE